MRICIHSEQTCIYSGASQILFEVSSIEENHSSVGPEYALYPIDNVKSIKIDDLTGHVYVPGVTIERYESASWDAKIIKEWYPITSLNIQTQHGLEDAEQAKPLEIIHQSKYTDNLLCMLFNFNNFIKERVKRIKQDFCDSFLNLVKRRA